MKKRIFVILVLAVVTAGGVFAQEKKWYNSYAPGIEGSKLLINAGIGFGINCPYLPFPPVLSTPG
jgi:hypothetical protein